MEFRTLLGNCKNCGRTIYVGDYYKRINNFTLFCNTECNEDWFRRKNNTPNKIAEFIADI